MNTKQRKPQGMVTSVIDWLHENGIYELAVTRMKTFERKGVDTTSVLSESLAEIVRAIKTLAITQAEEEMLVICCNQNLVARDNG
jgi:hypothetical protein